MPEAAMDVSAWVTALGTLALGAVALFGDTFRRWIYRPRLTLRMDNTYGELTTQTKAAVKSRWYHLVVSTSNRGYPFHDVVAYLVEVHQQHPNQDWVCEWRGRVPLGWRNDERPFVESKTIGPSHNVDLCYVREAPVSLRLRLSVIPNNLSDALSKTSRPLRFVVQASGNEADSELFTVEISWDRQWFDGAAEMADHFKVRVV